MIPLLIFLGFEILFPMGVIIFILSISKNKKMVKKTKTIKEKIPLTKKNIFNNSFIKERAMFLPFFLIFPIIGFILIYLNIVLRDGNTTKLIVSVIVGIISIVCPLIYIVNTIKWIINIFSGNYKITVDTLGDNDVLYYSENNIYLLYFNDYFKTYNSAIRVNNFNLFMKYQKYKKFYLIFYKNKNMPLIFPENEYILCENENKLVSIDELKKFGYTIKSSNKKIDHIPNITEPVKIDNKKIIKDFYNIKEKITILLYAFCFILSSVITVIAIKISISGFIIAAIATVFLAFMTFVKAFYIINTIKKIKNNNYVIKKDVVTKFNSRMRLKDYNDIISFKLSDYNKYIYESKHTFYDLKIGDEVYLVFINGIKEPIKAYDAKRNYI